MLFIPSEVSGLSGEAIELRVALWDTGDPWHGSVVLLDDFMWTGTPIVPGATVE